MTHGGDTALADTVEQALARLDSAAVLNDAQLPEILSQVLLWHSVQGGIHLVLAVLCVTLTLRVTYRIYQLKANGAGGVNWAWSEDSDDMTSSAFLLVTLLGILSFILTCLGIAGLLDMIQIQLAPKLYLLEYGASLID